MFTIATLHVTSVAYTQMLTSVCKEYHQLLSAVAIVIHVQVILHFVGVCCDADLLLWAQSSQILINCVLHILGGREEGLGAVEGGLLFDTHLFNNYMSILNICKVSTELWWLLLACQNIALISFSVLFHSFEVNEDIFSVIYIQMLGQHKLWYLV